MDGDGLSSGRSVIYSKCNPNKQGGWDLRRKSASEISMGLARAFRRPTVTNSVRLICRNVDPQFILRRKMGLVDVGYLRFYIRGLLLIRCMLLRAMKIGISDRRRFVFRMFYWICEV